MICTIADTRPTIMLPWDDVSRMQSDTDVILHKGDQPRLKAGQPYFPQDLFRSTAPDHLPALHTRPTNTRSSSTRTRQGRTLPPWNGLIIQALFLIAFLEDNDHASRTERCREGSPLRACQNLPHLNFLRTLRPFGWQLLWQLGNQGVNSIH